jgi:hypothetical protein
MLLINKTLGEGSKEEKATFDAFNFCQLLKEKSIIYMGFKQLQHFYLIRKFEIDEDNLAAFLTELNEGFSTNSNPFHNAIWTVDVMKTLQFFIDSANLGKYVSDLNILSLLLAGLIHDVQHPCAFFFLLFFGFFYEFFCRGTTNSFLINQKHPTAIRYNDISTIENYNLAYGFKYLMDHEADIFVNKNRV